MKIGLIALTAAICALAGAGASAQQVLNLTGEFRCVQGCLGSGPAYLTQNGLWSMKPVSHRERGSIGRVTSGRNIGTRVPSIHLTA